MADNPLTRKIGPLPTWGWVSIVGGAVLVWAWYSRHQASQASASSGQAVTPDVVVQQLPPDQGDEDTGNGEPERHHRHKPPHGKPPRKQGGGGTPPPTRRQHHHHRAKAGA